MYKILAIMGQAGAGKDYFLKTLMEGNYLHNAKEIVSCTTRPIRDNEKDGVNYHYLTNDEFAEQVTNGEMLEATIFNNWCYGTSLKSLDKNAINVGVFNPEGVEILQSNPEIDIDVVYITARDKVRLMRQLQREDNPDCDEIVRRYGTDKKDFSNSRIKEIAPDYVFSNNGDTDLKATIEAFAFVYNIGQDNIKN